MGNGCNRLHLNGVHLLEGVVKNSGGIDDLIPEILVVQVTNEQALGCLPSIRDVSQEASSGDLRRHMAQQGYLRG